MKRGLAVLSTILLIVLATACVVKSSQVVCSVEPTSGKHVKAKAGGVGVLSLSVPTLESKAQKKLLEQCGGKEVVNVNSQLTRRDFFIVQHYVLKLSGECKQ